MSMQSALTYGVGECTRFVAQVAVWVKSGWGDAYQWTGNAQKAGLTVDKTPRLGSVAVWQPGQGGALGAGHVAEVVGFQDNGVPIVQEQNWGSDTGPGGRSIGYNRPDTRALSAQEAGAAQYIQPPFNAPIPTQVPAALLAGSVDVAHYGMTTTTTSGLAADPLGIVGSAAGAVGSAVGSAAGAVGSVAGGVIGAVTDPLGALAGGIVSALGSAIGAMFSLIGSAIATFLMVTVEDLYAFVQNHIVPFAVAGVVTAALFA